MFKPLLACMGTMLFASVPYPQNFRGWTHVKSALITSAHPAFQAEGGIHHIYANPKATEGYASGQFSDGSVIVYELVETHEKDGVIAEGSRRRVDVMVKDATRFQATGGWGFERFMADSQTAALAPGAAAKSCYECHTRAQDHGLVFSRIR